MNVYIMNDLKNDGVLTNSGVAYYPNSTMSNNSTARIVYNGAYLGTNTNAEFASVFTHEFGHWMNLIHTFEGGCTLPNDHVADTPLCNFNGAAYTCHPTAAANSPVNCNNELINAENYMDYSGSDGCNKMFTMGQVARVNAALNHPARTTLWQYSNLVATGLQQLCPNLMQSNFDKKEIAFQIFPNPTSSNIVIKLAKFYQNLEYTLVNQLGMVVLKGKLTNENTTINLDKLLNGIYFINIEGIAEAKKIIKM